MMISTEEVLDQLYRAEYMDHLRSGDRQLLRDATCLILQLQGKLGDSLVRVEVLENENARLSEELKGVLPDVEELENELTYLRVFEREGDD